MFFEKKRFYCNLSKPILSNKCLLDNNNFSFLSLDGFIPLRDEDKKFIQWFVGFTDGEGHFSIISCSNLIDFRFVIMLHKCGFIKSNTKKIIRDIRFNRFHVL